MAMRTVCALLIAGVLIGAGGMYPAAAQQTQTRNRTVLWTVVGVAAGAGAGFLIGFHVFDDATYSERKILGATLAGGAIGGAVGFAIGRTRASSPRLTPSSGATAGPFSSPAPPLACPPRSPLSGRSSRWP